MFLHCRILSADVGAEADDADGGDAGVDQDEGAINVAVVEQALKAAPRRCRKSGKKSVTVTEVEKTEPRVKRGKGTKRDAEEPEKKDNAATEVIPKKRGRKPAATVADKQEEEEEDKEGEKKT